MFFKFVIYKITFPNEKIYIGKDISQNGHSLSYFGSWNSSIVEEDFTKEQLMNFSLKKEILFESTDVTEINRKEVEMIRKFKSNDPSTGYNRWPKYKNI